VAVYDQTEAAHGGLSVVERTRRIVHEPCSIKAHTFGYTRSILFESLRSLPRPASFQIIYVSGYKRKMNIGRQREPAVGAHIFDMSGGSQTRYASGMNGHCNSLPPRSKRYLIVQTVPYGYGRHPYHRYKQIHFNETSLQLTTSLPRRVSECTHFTTTSQVTPSASHPATQDPHYISLPPSPRPTMTLKRFDGLAGINTI
jgi:hypothetical protein